MKKNYLSTLIIFIMGGAFFQTDNTAVSASTLTGNGDFATFGAVHLNNTNLEAAKKFWIQIVGMTQRKSTNKMAEFGTTTQTLVVVHQQATVPFREGYSGLYHFAIHAPNEAEFARMLYRLLANNYPCSPTDHTMSKSVYLKDPDGITIEFALETPERFKRVVTERGMAIEDADGTIRPGAARLDIDDVLSHLPDNSTDKPLAEGTRIGHIHLYVKEVKLANEFYKKLGFKQFNYLPAYSYADVGAGGPYQHRVAMNEWHGHNRPLAPAGNAGLNQYHIVYKSAEQLNHVLKVLDRFERVADGYSVTDPTGNRIVLSHE